MSARGRHRRPRTQRLTRAAIALTAGGAGIALPLLGAGSASAASVDTWDKVAQCESTGNWQINSGNGYFGGLQFSQSTWEGFGGTEYAATADQATKAQQIAVAEKVLAEQGPGAWPSCGPKAGLTQNSGAPDVDPDAKSEGSADSADSAPAAEKAPAAPAAPEKKAPAKQAAPAKQDSAKQDSGKSATDYTVVSGDTLFKIASANGVDGGWERVYEDNREVVGDNPDLIYPDQKLSLDGKAAAPKAETSAQPKAEPKPEPKPEVEKQAKAAPKAETKPEPKPEPKQESAAPAAEQSSTGGFQAPVSGGVSTQYGVAGSSWSSGHHTGADFSVGTGTPVKAVSDGTIVSAGWGGSYGNQVVIKHTDGKYSQYGHLSSLSVSAGQTVGAGDQIGLSGSTGNSTGPHLHFEIRTGPDYGSDIDPVAYLRANGVNL
ncbi:transglycosylase family protein [Streptomyces sp. N2-109]|uniref:Transglycosylase family protein n=1 Tax=Streptomyces gossypii TaxID=2883101 RepID=A0ABT2JR26_9ACTN|nr:transglycosylase family protein [Streptomyces gossypii]MCT2590337.1 transglycosylase family protein [Streptomyces gossypii]